MTLPAGWMWEVDTDLNSLRRAERLMGGLLQNHCMGIIFQLEDEQWGATMMQDQSEVSCWPTRDAAKEALVEALMALRTEHVLLSMSDDEPLRHW